MAEERKKRPYSPPTIRTDKLYERRSLACSKVQPPPGPPNRRCQPPRGTFRRS